LQSNWGWRSWRAIGAALEQTRPDILHIQYQTGAYGMHPAVNLLPWRLGVRPNRPLVVVTAHDLLLPYLFPKAGPARRWVTRRLLDDADAVVLTNQADYAQIDRKPSNLQMVIPIGSNIAVQPPPGYDRAAWRSGLRVGSAETLVAYFGLISRSKGLDVLLDALALLPPNVRLLIVGGAATAPADRAYAQQIHQQIVGLHLSARVEITGHCSPDHVSAHLLAADLAVFPFADGASFRRGSLLAALAHGLPTITTSLPAQHGQGAKEQQRPAPRRHDLLSIAQPVLAGGANVLLVPPGDPSGLAGAIGRLAEDARLRARLAAGGRELARQFAWPAIAEQHEQLYARLLGATSSRGPSSR